MTKIEWVKNPDGTQGKTWNPVTGCTPISEGCRACYAKRMARRLAGRHGYPEAPNHFDVTLHRDRLVQPLMWRKPRMVFVCSMGDLFHEDVPDEFIETVWRTMKMAHQHTFQVLTKRADRMREWVTSWYRLNPSDAISNIWGLVTAENQEQAGRRIPDLLATRFAVRGVSCEPLLSKINLLPHLPRHGPNELFFRQVDHFFTDGRGRNFLDWVIAGGETGPGARPMKPSWARGLRDQCQDAGVSFFFKQQIVNGKKTRLLDGREWNEVPR